MSSLDNRTNPWRSFPIIAVILAGLICGCATHSTEPAKQNLDPNKSPVNAFTQPELVVFPAEGMTLQGFLYRPAGPGPFPAIVYNHGSDHRPGWFPPLGKFWTDHGYVFFVPHRRGHGRSSGEWIVDLQQKFREQEKDSNLARQHDVELHELANRDVVAAVAWVKEQPFVNPKAVVVSGISYGGIQTVLAAEKDLGVRVYVAFAPAAMSWAGNPLLRERLLTAVKKAKAPMFLLQAENDYNLGPSDLLGAELKRKGGLNRAKVYPPFGDKESHQDGHGGFAVRGSDVWGPDVLAFLDEALNRN